MDSPEQPVTHDGRPPWFGTVGAVAASLVVVALVADATVGLLAAVPGALCLGVGLWRTEQGVVTLGVAALLGAVGHVGVGRDPLWLLWATVPVVMAWVLASHAVQLGQQVGRTGNTVRVELVHGVSALVVVVLGGGVGYLGYRSAPANQSLLAIALFFGSVTAAALVLR